MRTLVQSVLVVVVLAIAAMFVKHMISTRPEAKREETEERGLLVETLTVRAGRHQVTLRGHGTVLPTQRVTLLSEISGRITQQSPQLEPGGFVRKGDAIVQVDPREYRLAVEARKAEVSRAELEVSIEKGRGQVAQREWQMFEQLRASEAKTTNLEQELALRGPQLRTAQVSLASAKSALERAQLDLERTTVRAPFNALVLEEHVDVGQLVSPQSALATLVGTDTYWVQASIPLEAVRYVRPADPEHEVPGSRALIWYMLGSARVELEGQVERILPDLDETGAMARVLVTVADPIGLRRARAVSAQSKGKGKSESKVATPANDAQPGANAGTLLLNAYVNVDIDAPPLEHTIAIPRAAMREGDRVYVVDRESRLRIVEPLVVWRGEDSVYVSEGIEDGAQVITSRVAAAVDGMSVRTERSELQASQASGAGPERGAL